MLTSAYWFPTEKSVFYPAELFCVWRAVRGPAILHNFGQIENRLFVERCWKNVTHIFDIYILSQLICALQDFYVKIVTKWPAKGWKIVKVSKIASQEKMGRFVITSSQTSWPIWTKFGESTLLSTAGTSWKVIGKDKQNQPQLSAQNRVYSSTITFSQKKFAWAKIVKPAGQL